MNPNLEALAQALIQNDYPAKLVEASGEGTADQIFIPVQFRLTALNSTIELTLAGDLNPEIHGEMESVGLKHLDFLQYFVLFPFQVPNEQIIDLVRLVTMINNSLPLLGFGVMESQNRVFFRHMQILIGEKIDPQIVTFTLSTIEYLVNTVGQALLDISENKRSLQQILSDDIYWE